MPEDVVEQVGLIKIIELVMSADEIADRKHLVGEHREEHRVGHQPRHRDRSPSGAWLEPCVELGEIGHPGVRQPQQVEPVAKRPHDLLAQRRDLPREQNVPHAVILDAEVPPVLGNDVVLPAGTCAARGLVEGFMRHWGSSSGNKKPRRSEVRGSGRSRRAPTPSPPRSYNKRLSASASCKGWRSGSLSLPIAFPC